ncbi:hypothetical protein M9435_002980 [Picochlorum sp. BPE23]|nr:hypothetical protein M9435_002980 [Picochlorum sp. BPE23]
MSFSKLIVAIVWLAVAGRTRGEDSDLCKEYELGAEMLPSDVTGVVEKALRVEDAYPLGDVIVPFNVWHPRVEDLKVTLSAEAQRNSADKMRTIKRVVLKEAGQGVGNNMSVVFTDIGGQRIQDSGDIRGAVRPFQKLSFFYRNSSGKPSVIAARGGSIGTWTLQVEDTAADEAVRRDPLFDWSLILCKVEAKGISMPQLATGVSSDAVQAFSGATQPSQWTIIDGGQVKDINIGDSLDSYLQTINQDCGTDTECEDKKRKLLASAAALIYLGMKDGDNSPVSRISSLLEKAVNATSARFADSKLNKMGFPWIGQKEGIGSSIFPNFNADGLRGPAIEVLGNLLSQLPFLGKSKDKDKIIWSRDLANAKDHVENARSELRKSIADWKVGLGTGDQLKRLLNLGKPLPDFSDIEDGLSNVLSHLSENAQNLMESRSQQRGKLVANVESRLNEVQNKIDTRMNELSNWKLNLPDLSTVKEKIQNSKDQLKGNINSAMRGFQKPAERFKEKIGSAVEKTVKAQLDSALSEDNLAQLLNDTDNSLAKAIKGFDLSGVPRGLNLDFSNGLSLDGPFGQNLVGELLGIDDPEETKALMEGLKEAGFQDLMTEFLNPALL